MKLPRSGANLRLADEEAGERISVDAVRGVGPLRMIHREVNRTAPAAGLCTGLVRTAGHLWEATEVEVHCVCYGRSCSAFHLRTAHWSTLRSGRFILCVRRPAATRVGLNRAITVRA